MSYRRATKFHRSYSEDISTSDSYENFLDTLYGLPLGSSDAATFRARPFVVRRNRDGTLEVCSTDVQALSFESMCSLRNDPANRELRHDDIMRALRSPSGFAVSNVGVSVALEITIHNRRFAVLVESTPGSAYKLISGYCDIGGAASYNPHPAAEFLVTACRELLEELLVCRPSRSQISVIPLQVRSTHPLDEMLPLPAGIPPHYVQNISIDSTHPPIQVTRGARPAYLAGTFEPSKIIVDGQSLEAAFYLDRRYRSSQVVFSFTLDLSGSEYTLLHAEDSYCAENRRLETVLHPHGLILAELAPNGRLLGDFFRMHEGKLVQRTCPTKIQLSEIFTTCSGTPGIIEHGAVSISEYLLNQGRLGGSR